jgi:hypothetical protein
MNTLFTFLKCWNQLRFLVRNALNYVFIVRSWFDRWETQMRWIFSHSQKKNLKLKFYVAIYHCRERWEHADAGPGRSRRRWRGGWLVKGCWIVAVPSCIVLIFKISSKLLTWVTWFTLFVQKSRTLFITLEGCGVGGCGSDGGAGWEMSDHSTSDVQEFLMESHSSCPPPYLPPGSPPPPHFLGVPQEVGGQPPSGRL